MLPEEIELTPAIRIPTWELQFKFVRSSGPGGQNVNKLSTKVELYFNIRKSPSIPAEQKRLIMEKLSSHIDAGGSIRVVSQTERSQLANRIKAIHKLESVLKNGLKRPRIRRLTKPTLISKEERIHEKKVRSSKIKSRHYIPDE